MDDAQSARAWLRRLAGRVTSAAPWTDGKPETTLNVRFTYAGLQALGLPDEAIASFSEAFREGMAARALLLGDVGGNRPSEWEPGLGTGEAHVLVRVDAQDSKRLEPEVERLRGEIEGVGAVVNEQRSAFLPSGRNHFGYVEGAGAVAVLGSGLTP